MPDPKRNYSLILLYFSLVVLLSTAIIQARWNWQGNRAVISWDVSAYYSYLPQIFIYHDINHLAFLDSVATQQYECSPFVQQAIAGPLGIPVFKTSYGLSFFYLPAFAVAHLIAKFSDYKADGFSLPYQICLQLWSVLFSWFGLFFLRKILRSFYSEIVTTVTLFLLLFATNFFEYSAVIAPMPHGYLFTLYALLLLSTSRWHEKPSIYNALIIGFCCGFISLSRPTEIICLFIPLLWGVFSLSSFKNKIKFLLKFKTHVMVIFLLLFIIALPQLLYWKYSTGHYFFYSYQDDGFNFLHPYFKEVLYQSRKGWLLYTPIMIFAIAGFYNFKNNTKIFLPLFLVFIINIYVVCSWRCWWYGGSFGMRAIVQTYAVLAFPLASFIQYSINKKILRWVTSVLFLFFTWLNLFQIWQFNNGILPADGITDGYYFSTFGKLHITSDDLAHFELRHTYPELINVKGKTIFYNNFESDSLATDSSIFVSGKHSLLLNSASSIVELTLKLKELGKVEAEKTYLKISCKAYSHNLVWDIYSMSHIFMNGVKNDHKTFYKYLIIQNKIGNAENAQANFLVGAANEWDQLNFIACLKDFEGYNEIQFGIFNHENNIINIDDFKIELITSD